MSYFSGYFASHFIAASKVFVETVIEQNNGPLIVRFVVIIFNLVQVRQAQVFMGTWGVQTGKREFLMKPDHLDFFGQIEQFEYSPKMTFETIF